MQFITEALSVLLDAFKNFNMLPPSTFHQNFEFSVYVICFKSSKIHANMQWNTISEATVQCIGIHDIPNYHTCENSTKEMLLMSKHNMLQLESCQIMLTRRFTQG